MYERDVIAQKNNRLFCCLSFRDFEPKILIKGIHTKKFLNVQKKVDFFLMKKGVHIMNQKEQNKVYVTVLFFYSIFNTSSCRKPEIQNDLPKRIC